MGADGLSDPVEGWKRSVHERLVRATRPTITAHFSFGFLGIGLLVGASAGWLGLVATLPLLLSILLCQELPRAFVAYSRRRSARVELLPIGGRTRVLGEALPARAAIWLAPIGSLCNLAVALGVWVLGPKGSFAPHSPSLLHAFALGHFAWASVQLLPLRSFRAGELILPRLTPRARLTVSLVVLLLVLRAFVALSASLSNPLLLTLSLLVLVATGQSVIAAFQELVDAELGIPSLVTRSTEALKNGDAKAAVEHARSGLARARSREQRTKLWRAFAWASIGAGDPFSAHVALLGLGPDGIDVHLLASYLASCNRSDEAIDVLRNARALGHFSRETTKLWIDLSYRQGDERAVAELARADGALLSAEDQSAVAKALAESNG